VVSDSFRAGIAVLLGRGGMQTPHRPFESCFREHTQNPRDSTSVSPSASHRYARQSAAASHRLDEDDLKTIGDDLPHASRHRDVLRQILCCNSRAANLPFSQELRLGKERSARFGLLSGALDDAITGMFRRTRPRLAMNGNHLQVPTPRAEQGSDLAPERRNRMRRGL
jgi:hypothetical protein